MKKLFVLMVLVVAMVAAPLFAEITEDGWAGDFTYKMGGNFTDSAVDSVDNDMDLSMSASIGEFTTFSVGIEADPFATSGTTTFLAVDTDGDGVYDEADGDVEAETASGIQGAVKFNTIEMTQDFGAMLGLDFGLTMKVGNFNHEVAEYEIKDQMGQTDSDTENSVELALTFGDIAAYAWVSPTSLTNDEYKDMAFEAKYTSDMISGNVAYVNKNAEKGVVAAGLKLVVADANVAAMVNQNLDTEVTMLSAGASYTFAPVTAKAEFYTSDMENLDTNGMIQVGVDYAATDDITVKAGANIPLDSNVDMGFDGGVCFKVDTVGYTVGASYKGGDYVAPYGSDEVGAEDFAVSFKMDVDF